MSFGRPEYLEALWPEHPVERRAMLISKHKNVMSNKYRPFLDSEYTMRIGKSLLGHSVLNRERDSSGDDRGPDPTL